MQLVVYGLYVTLNWHQTVVTFFFLLMIMKHTHR